MVDQNTVKEYSDSIQRFRNQCLDAGMSEDEFRQLYFESLQSLQNNNRNTPNNMHQVFKTKYKVLFILVIVVGCFTYNYKTIYSCVLSHLQEYIYPGLKLLRRISIPFLSLFPSLTDLYHETCLIQNPFFTVTDMDCWPCSSITNIREIQNPKPSSQQQNAPFIYEVKEVTGKTDQRVIDFDFLRTIYERNKVGFEKGSLKILVNDKYYISLDEMFSQNVAREKNLYVWKFNNLQIARIFRQYIPRPVIVPKFGQSTERFVIIDSGQKSFKIPDTECSYSFLLSLSGTRIINLVPAEECKHQCKILKVELQETYLLWYNWWYWRPIVQPSASNVTFIAHVGSYC